MMACGLRLREFLALAVLMAQILYCSSSDDTNSSTTEWPLVDKIIDNVGKIIPQCVFNNDSVSFYLFTMDHPYGVHVDETNVIEMAKLTTNTCVDLVVAVHGFTSSGNSTSFYEIMQECIKEPRKTCISYDWSIPACYSNITMVLNNLAYRDAIRNTKSVGELLGKLILSLYEKDICLNSIEIVGHSLGAHVAGFAAKYVKRQSNHTVDKITGLDPAGPGFQFRKETRRLAKGDACLVQIIHTSFLGIQKCIGDSDTFVNGGHYQPHCHGSVSCSHSFALKLYRSCIDCECLASPYRSHEETTCPPSYFAKPRSPSCCTEGTCACAKIGLGNSCRYNATGVLGMVTPHRYPFCNSNSTSGEMCKIDCAKGQ